ncbi:MAG TPA: glycosyl transferase, partial [Marinobacter sp.]|nr:glycosyl transferase [Marinobacter sp.]
LLDKPRPEIELPERFLLRAQTEGTLGVYEKALRERPS